MGISVNDTLIEMWERIDSLPPSLRQIAVKYWDVCGRPTRDEIFVKIKLLNLSNSFDEYWKNYITFFNIPEEESERNKAIYDWNIFYAGIEKTADYIKKSF